MKNNCSQMLCFCCLILNLNLWTVAANNTAPGSFHVGLILDLDTSVGKLSHRCIGMAVSDFYDVNVHYRTRLVLHTRHSKDVSAVFAAVELLKDVEVRVIVGPQKSAQAQSVAEIGNMFQVPVVSFSATSSSLSTSHMPYFIQMTHKDTYQLEAIASIIQAFGWKEVILVHEETEYGSGIIPYLIAAFQTIDVQVPYQSAIHPSATEDQILQELHKLSTMQTRVFLVHMSSSLGPQFFLKVKEIGLMAEGIKSYIPRSRELDKFQVRLMRKIFDESEAMDEPNIFCLHAYDTIWMLAMAAEKVGTDYSFQQAKRYKSFAHLAELGVSLMGPELLKEILRTKFKGLSGDIRLVDGQLQSLVLQILNVVGKGEREIGFWIPLVGVSQRSEATTMKMYKTTQANLRPIIWPGESTTPPKGWVIPSNGKKLRIGFPLKDSFAEFVKLDLDSNTNRTIFLGYCIDVFIAVMKELPYNVPYEFVPFKKANGQSAGNYNDLVDQVSRKIFDAVIGDITITANRSVSVDFSLPYTTGGVYMVIPVKYEENNFFFNPYSKDVWLSTISLMVSAILIVWVLENWKSSDPLSQQILKILRISSIASAAHSFPQVDDLKNVSKLILRISIVPLYILSVIYVQLYANAVTNQGLHLTMMEVSDLLRNGDFVGYQKGSFVEMVLKDLHFQESKLKAYNSPEEYEEALNKGSQNGGVAAIFDEMPYIKLLIRKYCGKLMRIGPVYRTEGFGFVFPKGSPLVPDVSRAILSVVEGATMVEIEMKWLGSESHCPDPSKYQSSRKIAIKQFAGLFIFVVVIQYFSLVPFGLAFFNRSSGHQFWKLLSWIFQIPEIQGNSAASPNTEALIQDEAAVTREESVVASEKKEGSSEPDHPPSSSLTEIGSVMKQTPEPSYSSSEEDKTSNSLIGFVSIKLT